AVATDAHQAVGAEQQVSGEPLDRLPELELRARLSLGREPAPRVVELVEGEADDLAAFPLSTHGTKSNAEVGTRNGYSGFCSAFRVPRFALLLPRLTHDQPTDAPEDEHRSQDDQDGSPEVDEIQVAVVHRPRKRLRLRR